MISPVTTSSFGKVASSALFEAILPEFDAVSFDVFDTLLVRPFVHPSDLFGKMERDEFAPGFATARVRAGRDALRAARRAGRAEATLAEIYARIPARWAPMLEKELAAERAALSANPEVLAMWRAAKEAGKKLVIASDMYLPEEFLKSVLRENGVDGWDVFLLSVSCQKRKGDGSLFGALLESMPDIAPGRILHVGDNPDSDVARAVEKGLVSLQSPRVFESFLDENPFVGDFLGPHPSLDKRLFAGAISAGWMQFRAQHPECTYWNKIGYLFAGPLATAYMRFVAADAEARGIEHLLFIARDGYVLQRVFRVLRPDIRTDYVYASREQALFATQYLGRAPVGAALRRRRLLAALVKLEGVRLSPEEEAVFLAGGPLPPVAQSALDGVSVAMKAEAKRYFGAFGLRPGAFALVDGNSVHFTAQRFVETVTGGEAFTYYLFTLDEPERGAALYRAAWSPRYHHFSEFLLGAPTPPVRDVVDGEPVFEENLPFFERFKVSVAEQIASGAEDAARFLARFGAPATHALWQDWCDVFFDHPSAEDHVNFSLARNSVALRHDGGFEPVLAPRRPDHRLRLFGRTVIAFGRSRLGETQLRDVLVFGRVPILRIPSGLWRALSAFLHSIRSVAKGGARQSTPSSSNSVIGGKIHGDNGD